MLYLSAFRKAGVVPINKQEILSRMPRQDRDINLNMVGDVFLTHLTEKRQEFVGPRINTKRKKLNVPHGRSICQGDIQQPETSAPRTEQQPAKKKRRAKRPTTLNSTSEEDDSFSIASSGISGVSNLFASCADEHVEDVLLDQDKSSWAERGSSSRPGMCNVWPAGRMRPAELIFLASSFL
jgi:hypothetical protein